MEEKTSITNTNLENAKAEIEALLKKYEVILVPIVVHRGEKTFSRIDIVPIKEMNNIEDTQA